jgi:hypothetical protein
MAPSRSIRVLVPLAVLLAAAQTMTVGTLEAQHSAADREALFDYILKKTMEREAFSPIKNRALGLDVEREMLRFRDEMIAADMDEKLYYALVKISNARKDRHLRVRLVEGGLSLSDTTGGAQENYPVPGTAVLHAPIRFATDYGTPGQYFVFVADFARDIAEFSGGIEPEVGDRLLAINGGAFSEYVEDIEPYHRYSTVNGFWWQLAAWIPQKSYQFPRSFYREKLELELERQNGERYTLVLPFLPSETISWKGHGTQRYSGFDQVFSTPTFDLHVAEGKPVLLLNWHGFVGSLVDDVDRLMEYAAQHDLLDHAVIVDATRSRGGSLGAYAVRRLSPRPFKTTFGNLRISDAAEAFVDDQMQRLRARTFSPRPGELDDGTWRLEWFEGDVTKAIEAGQRYTNNVPFKTQHLPHNSDGIIDPADVHFRGSLVCWFGPYGGSHLDQFASIVVDNKLAYTMGMPAGGYSNTWEWEEVLVFPTNKRPVVEFMWSIGHTIRPNGEILEGNPAQVDEFMPVTRDNYRGYYELLLSRTLEHLGLQ